MSSVRYLFSMGTLSRKENTLYFQNEKKHVHIPVEGIKEIYAYLASNHVPCLLYQGRYNLFNREPEEEGILDQASEHGSGFVAFSPLAQGLLTNRYLNGIPDDSRIARGGHLKKEALTEDVFRKIRDLNEIAARRGQTLAEMSLAWLLKDEKVTSVIIGASSVKQIDDDLKSLDNTSFCDEEICLINNALNR